MTPTKRSSPCWNFACMYPAMRSSAVPDTVLETLKYRYFPLPEASAAVKTLSNTACPSHTLHSFGPTETEGLQPMRRRFTAEAELRT